MCCKPRGRGAWHKGRRTGRADRPGTGLPVPGRRSFALAFPLVSLIAFFFAGVFGLAGGASTSFGDLTIWGVVSLILAVLSYFGWREKRKRRREEAARVV
jgi:hypothetical protein